MDKCTYNYCVERIYEDFIAIDFNELLNYIFDNCLNILKKDCDIDLIIDYLYNNAYTVLDGFNIDIDTGTICDFDYFILDVCDDFRKWLNDNFENWLNNE